MLTNPTFETLKSTKPTFSHPETETVISLHRASHIKFDRSVRANSFLAYKKNAISQIFTNKQTKPVAIDKLRKKYFGRKVRYISHPHQAILCHKYAKYIHNISWIEKYSRKTGVFRRNPNNDSIQNYLAVKSLGDLVTIDPDIALSRKTVLRLILASYPRASIKLDNCFKLNMVKWKLILPSIKGLVKQINLELLSSDDVKKKHEDLFVEFDSLKSFSLHGNQLFPLVDYIPKLLEIQTLQYLYLDFGSAILGYLPFADICTQIEAHNIPKWHIRVRAKFEAIVQDKHDFIFKKIDCLGLGKVYAKPPFGGAGDFHYYGFPIHTTSAFSEMKHLHEKRKKILELAILELTKFDIGQLLNRCKSLEALYIRLNDYDYMISYSPSDNLWPSNLKDVVLSWTRSTNPDSTFDQLVSKIKTECLQLETLELFSCRNTSEDHVDQEGILTTSKYTYIMDAPDITGLEKLTSLRHLRLGTIQDLQSVLAILSHLPNLRRLELTLGEPQPSENLEPWDNNLVLSAFVGLEELKVNKVFTASREWGKGLLENLQYLKNLQALELEDSTEDKMSLEMFKLLVEGFCLMGNIKRLALNVSVKSQNKKDKKELEREEVLKEVKKLIMGYLKSNKNLEKINIGKIKDSEFVSIKYNRS